jgi:nucleotide-binding universal stress UspA family protein
MSDPKSILVPTDFSSYSDAALKKAVELAEQYHSKIYLLHVIDKGIQQCSVDYCITPEVFDQLVEQSLKASNDKLQKEVDAIIGDKKLDVVFDVQKGHPAEVILKEQQDKGIDLIVIASHGRTGLLKNLMGSVAGKVIRGSKCAVMVVKP